MKAPLEMAVWLEGLGVCLSIYARHRRGGLCLCTPHGNAGSVELASRANHHSGFLGYQTTSIDQSCLFLGTHFGLKALNT